MSENMVTLITGKILMHNQIKTLLLEWRRTPTTYRLFALCNFFPCKFLPVFWTRNFISKWKTKKSQTPNLSVIHKTEWQTFFFFLMKVQVSHKLLQKEQCHILGMYAKLEGKRVKVHLKNSIFLNMEQEGKTCGKTT